MINVGLAICGACGLTAAGVGGNEAVSAFIDPIFTAPLGYTIELSPGIGNSAATPLPPAWTMMLIGLPAFVCMALWRTKTARVSLIAA
jgi:hypothetical protein